MSFPAFAAVYTGAVLLGVISHAPGGLGVFEATMLAIFHEHGRAEVMAGLLLYRVIYNFCPFLMATFALAFEDLRMFISSRAGNS
jgi:phosphatidylglycerol lysyltransferase